MKKLLLIAGILLSSVMVLAEPRGLKDVICVFQRYRSEWSLATYAFSLSSFTMSPGEKTNLVDFIMKDVPEGARQAALCLQLEGTSSPAVVRANALRSDAEDISSIDKDCRVHGVDVRLLNKGSKEISYGGSLQYETPWPSGENGAIRLVEYIATPQEMSALDERSASRICERFLSQL